jgi:hypothetical protein
MKIIGLCVLSIGFGVVSVMYYPLYHLGSSLFAGVSILSGLLCMGRCFEK